MVARSFTVGGVVQAGSAWLWCVDSRLAGVQTNGFQLGIVLPIGRRYALSEASIKLDWLFRFYLEV